MPARRVNRVVYDVDYINVLFAVDPTSPHFIVLIHYYLIRGSLLLHSCFRGIEEIGAGLSERWNLFSVFVFAA